MPLVLKSGDQAWRTDVAVQGTWPKAAAVATLSPGLKAALAENRRALMHAEGGFIAYVLDGAGNFSRRAALTTLCQSSDCTVAYSDKELNVLVDFIRGKLDDAVR